MKTLKKIAILVITVTLTASTIVHIGYNPKDNRIFNSPKYHNSLNQVRG